MDYQQAAMAQASAKEREFKQSIMNKLDTLTKSVDELVKKLDNLEGKKAKE